MRRNSTHKAERGTVGRAGTGRTEFIDELAHRRIPLVPVTADERRDEIRLE